MRCWKAEDLGEERTYEVDFVDEERAVRFLDGVQLERRTQNHVSDKLVARGAPFGGTYRSIL